MMPKQMIWRVRLKSLLSDEQLRESPYRIAEKLGMSKNTVRRYMENDEELTIQVSANVGVLARYFGLDEHQVFQLIEVSDSEADIEGQTKTLLATA
jgi:plasmid maintenance system antidote protein VapI